VLRQRNSARAVRQRRRDGGMIRSTGPRDRPQPKRPGLALAIGAAPRGEAPGLERRPPRGGEDLRAAVYVLEAEQHVQFLVRTHRSAAVTPRGRRRR